MFEEVKREPAHRIYVHSRVGNGTVLVADDMDCVRGATAELLRRVGFHVITATDSREAVGICRAHADEMVAVLLDYHMPGGSGSEVLAELRLIKNGMPVIVMSAEPVDELKEYSSSAQVAGILHKPFTRMRLLHEIHNAIGR